MSRDCSFESVLIREKNVLIVLEVLVVSNYRAKRLRTDSY